MLAGALAIASGGAQARPAYVGVLVQLPGLAGCTSEDGTGGTCATGRALHDARGGIVTPDGRSFYVTSYILHAVSAFSRNRATGALTQLPGRSGCVSQDGTGGTCARGHGLGGARALAASPDGRNVYAATAISVVVFARNRSTGALTQLAGSAGCVDDTGFDGCADGVGLRAPISVAVSPDNRNVYAASNESDAIGVFRRNTRTGALTQLTGRAGCVSEDGTHGACARGRGLGGTQFVGVSPDGRSVYSASPGAAPGGFVAVFARNLRTGALRQLPGATGCLSNTGRDGCAGARGLKAPWTVAVSRDGASAYIPAADALTVFSRDAGTGALTQLPGRSGCWSDDGTGGACTDGRALHDPVGAVVSPDGANVYAVSIFSDGVSVFERDPRTGALAQPPRDFGCVNDTGAEGCGDGRALRTPFTVSVSPDARNVYVSTFGSHSVAVFGRSSVTPPPETTTTTTTTATPTTTTPTTTTPTTTTTPPKSRNARTGSTTTMTARRTTRSTSSARARATTTSRSRY